MFGRAHVQLELIVLVPHWSRLLLALVLAPRVVGRLLLLLGLAPRVSYRRPSLIGREVECRLTKTTDVVGGRSLWPGSGGSPSRLRVVHAPIISTRVTKE